MKKSNIIIPYLEASFICMSNNCLLLASRTTYDKNFYGWLWTFAFFIVSPLAILANYLTIINYINNADSANWLLLPIGLIIPWLLISTVSIMGGLIGSRQLRHLSPIIFNRKTQKVYTINMKGETVIIPWKEVSMEAEIHSSSPGGAKILESVLDIRDIGDIRTPVSYMHDKGTASEQAAEFIRVFMEKGPDNLLISMPEGYALENQKYYSFDLKTVFQHLSIWPIYTHKDKIYDYLMHKAIVRWPFRIFFFAIYIATHIIWRWLVKKKRHYPEGAFEGCKNEVAVTQWDVYQHITQDDYNELTENYLDLPYKELRKRMQASGLSQATLDDPNHGVYREAKTPSIFQNILSLLISLGLIASLLWWALGSAFD